MPVKNAARIRQTLEFTVKFASSVSLLLLMLSKKNVLVEETNYNLRKAVAVSKIPETPKLHIVMWYQRLFG